MTSPIDSLTSTFTEAAHCSLVAQTTGYWPRRGFSCASDGSLTRDSACYPGAGTSLALPLVYSPAVACPAGWSTVASDTAGSGGTTLQCCPSEFSIVNQEDATYCSKVRGINSISVYSCSGSSLVNVFDGFGEGPISAFAYQIRVVLPHTTASSSFSSSSVSSSATPRASSSTIGPTGAPSTLDPDSAPKKKLSGGAIAGIVIGVLALLLLLVAAFVFMRRRKRRQQGDQTAAKTGGGDLPEYIAPYPNTTTHQSETKVPAMADERANTPSLRTAVSPMPTTPTSEVPELVNPPQVDRNTYSTTTSATYPRSPLSEHISSDSPRDSQVAKLEAEKAALEERIARMRQIAQMEEEQAGMQAELERLRASGGR